MLAHSLASHRSPTPPRLGRTNDCRYDPPHFFQRSGSHDTLAQALSFCRCSLDDGSGPLLRRRQQPEPVCQLQARPPFDPGRLPSISDCLGLPAALAHSSRSAPVADDQPAAAAPAAGRPGGGRHPVLAVGAGSARTHLAGHRPADDVATVCHPGVSPLSQRAGEPGPHCGDPGPVLSAPC